MALDLIHGLRPLLLTCDDLTELVAHRIQPLLLEQGTKLPALTYQRIGGSASPTFETSGMFVTRVEFRSHGKKYSDASAVISALSDFLNGYQGILADGTQVADAEYLMENDWYAHDSEEYQVVCEFYLHHT